MYSSLIAKMCLPFPFSLAASSLFCVIQDKYRSSVEDFTNTIKIKQLSKWQKTKLKFSDFTFVTEAAVI